jgi:hypothetical protein
MSRVDLIHVERLLRLYNPFRQFFARTPDLATIRKTPVVEGRTAFRPDELGDARRNHDVRRNRRWDRGRVRYFVELMEAGTEIDPIEVDNECDRGHIYGPILLDGHHRLCAAALLKVPTIRARYGGRVDTLKYLIGKTPHPPRDLCP